MKAFIFFALVAFASAELYDECTSDNDCDEKEETCHKKPTFENPGEFEEKGICFHKQKEFDFCVLDSNCEEDHYCFHHVLLDTPAPVFGRCVQCRSDDDCEESDYCKHPVINGHCQKTFAILEKVEKYQAKHDKQMERFIEHKYSSGSEEDEEEQGAENPRFQGQGSRDQQEVGGGDRRQGRFPNFPTFDSRNDQQSRSGRNKRGLGDPFVINIPNMRCTTKHPANAPCDRSAECKSGTCSIEGFCQ